MQWRPSPDMDFLPLILGDVSPSKRIKSSLRKRAFANKDCEPTPNASEPERTKRRPPRFRFSPDKFYR